MNLRKKQLAKIGLKEETTTGTPVKPKKFVTEAARAAIAIRAELKKSFPKIKFSVKSKCYVGGSNVSIYWVDGPMPRSVEKCSAKFQLGSFNPQTDFYEFTNRQPEIPQVYYIHLARAFSDFNIEATKRALKIKFQLADFSDALIQKKFKMLPDQLLQKVLSSLDFPPREESMRKIRAEAENEASKSNPIPKNA